MNGPRVTQDYNRTSAEWAERGDWARVLSSNVAKIRYDKNNHRLYVAFLSGHQGYYDYVPRHEAEAMFNSTSMGKFIHYRLKPRYRWVK